MIDQFMLTYYFIYRSFLDFFDLTHELKKVETRDTSQNMWLQIVAVDEEGISIPVTK